MVLRAADAVLDGQVLHRLHIERHAGDLRELGLQAPDDFGGMQPPLAERLQVDQHAPAIQRGVGAVDADEGGEALDRRVLQDDVRERLLLFRHRGEGDALRRFGDSLDHARVLHREEAFRHEKVEHHRQHERRGPDEERRRLPIEHPVERAAVARDHVIEHAARRAREARLALFALRTQQARAHHRRERQRHHRRYKDGDGERDGEFAEQAADDVAHEEQRNQHRHQREGERDDGEGDLLGALERRLERRLARLDVAGDVLDDHDRVVDHEARGDHQRHQRQVVDREAGEVHEGEGADER